MKMGRAAWSLPTCWHTAWPRPSRAACMHACVLLAPPPLPSPLQPAPLYAATPSPRCLHRSFRLLNIRQDFQLALISNSTGTPTVLAVSPVMRNKISNQPTLIHVAPGAIPTAG